MKISGIITLLFLSASPGWIFSQEYNIMNDLQPALVTEWELSATFDVSGVPHDTYPHFITIFNSRWEQVSSNSAGWINITRRRGIDTSAYGAFCRTFIYSGEDTRYKITFEYSEEISLFLNGKFIQQNSIKGKNTPGSIDIELTARKGLNELFVFIISRSSNWKFRVSSYPKIRSHEVNHTLTHVTWETESNLLTPESVQYDPQNDMYYATSYDIMYYSKGSPSGYVTKIDRNGKIIDHQWIKGLFAPTGMCIYKNKLYVTVRNGVVVFDTKKGDYITQYDIVNTEFLNDIAVDSLGRIYISDTSSDPDKPDIYILENNEVHPWYQSEQVSHTNGIYVYRGRLLIGNNGHGLFQAIDLDDKSITTICSLGAGIIDGIRIGNDGNYLVSHWEGKIFRITPQGNITEICDTRLAGYNTADFEFTGESNTLFIPTFLGDKIVALKLDY